MGKAYTILHNSLSPLSDPTLDFYHPACLTEIGILIRRYDSDGMHDIHSECPRLSTVTTGEQLGTVDNAEDLTNLDSLVRSHLLTMAEHCRNLSLELERHAERLEEQAALDADSLLSDRTPQVREDSDIPKPTMRPAAKLPNRGSSRDSSHGVTRGSSLDLGDIDLDLEDCPRF